MSEVFWLVGLFVITLVVRVFILAVSIFSVGPGDTNGTVTIDVILNAVLFIGIVASVKYGIFHPSITVFYGMLAEIVICWLVGFIPICMSTENPDIREMPSSLPRWLRP